MLREGITVPEIVAINHCILKARLYTNEYLGAVVAGQLAVRLARDNGMWDIHGSSCLFLGVTYGKVNRHHDAVGICLEYIEHLPKYGKSRSHEMMVYYNLGVAFYRLGEFQQSAQMMQRALDRVMLDLEPWRLFGVRLSLVNLSSKMGSIERTPFLLAQCFCHLRRHAGEAWTAERWLWLYQVKSESCIRGRRWHRARRIAERGLALSHGWPELQFHFHLLLAQISIGEAKTRQALTHALVARVFAIRCHRFDLEQDASDYLYSLMRADAHNIDQLQIPPVLQEMLDGYPVPDAGS